MGGSTKSVFNSIMGYLGNAVDFVCLIKYKIMSYFEKKFRKRFRLFFKEKVTKESNGGEKIYGNASKK